MKRTMISATIVAVLAGNVSAEIAPIVGLDYYDFTTSASIRTKYFELEGATSQKGCRAIASHWIYSGEAANGMWNLRESRFNYASEIPYTQNLCEAGSSHYQFSNEYFSVSQDVVYDATNTDTPWLDTIATYHYANPVPLFNANLYPGSVVTNSSNAITEIIGFEDVTLPLNGGETYQDCLVSNTQYTLPSGETSEYTDWRCEEMGVVKRIRTHGSETGVYLLKEVQYF